jgi:hypothetical protein
MLDKIRLAQAGKLPPAWLEAKGATNGFDGICSRFLSYRLRRIGTGDFERPKRQRGTRVGVCKRA